MSLIDFLSAMVNEDVHDDIERENGSSYDGNEDCGYDNDDCGYDNDDCSYDNEDCGCDNEE